MQMMAGEAVNPGWEEGKGLDLIPEICPRFSLVLDRFLAGEARTYVIAARLWTFVFECVERLELGATGHTHTFLCVWS
jgi:hypothetical protein